MVAAYVFRKAGEEIQLLLMQRPPDCRYAPLTWQIVYGHKELFENGDNTILREIREETGINPESIYNTDKRFYNVRENIWVSTPVPVYVAFVDYKATVVLNSEHIAYQWCDLADAEDIFIWPDQVKMLKKIRTVFIENNPPRENRIEIPL